MKAASLPFRPPCADQLKTVPHGGPSVPNATFLFIPTASRKPPVVNLTYDQASSAVDAQPAAPGQEEVAACCARDLAEAVAGEMHMRGVVEVLE